MTGERHDVSAVEHRLGVDPDAAIARDLGVHTTTVRHARLRRGIAAPPPPKRSPHDYVAAGAGQRPDPEVAAALGVRVLAVRQARQRLGIPACRAGAKPKPRAPAPPSEVRAVGSQLPRRVLGKVEAERQAVEDRVARSVRWARAPLSEDEVARRSGVSRHAVLAALRGAEERGLVRRVADGWGWCREHPTAARDAVVRETRTLMNREE